MERLAVGEKARLRFFDCKIVEPSEKPPFVSFPQTEWVWGGSTQYKKLVELTGPLAQAFQDAVLGAWEVSTNAAA